MIQENRYNPMAARSRIRVANEEPLIDRDDFAYLDEEMNQAQKKSMPSLNAKRMISSALKNMPNDAA